jgi:hypothetical protein
MITRLALAPRRFSTLLEFVCPKISLSGLFRALGGSFAEIFARSFALALEPSALDKGLAKVSDQLAQDRRENLRL